MSETNRSDPAAEYQAARQAAITVDLSLRGRVRVDGRDRLDLLQRLTTSDMAGLSPGRGIQNLFLTSKGRIIEFFDLLAFEDHLELFLASTDAPAIVEWIGKYVFMEDVTPTDSTADTFGFEIYGPQAAATLAAAGAEVTGLSDRDHRAATVGGTGVVVGAAEPIAGAGYRLSGARADSAGVWQALLDAGTPLGLRAASAPTLEILRVEAGIPAAGHELSEQWNPLEAELGHAISVTKGCYTGQEVVARLANYKKVQRGLRGLRVLGQTIPPLGSQVVAGKERVGTVTSAVRSPALGSILALAYIDSEQCTPGTRLAVEIESRGEFMDAEVLESPFVATG
jgi:folate-binding protein YgfZ